MLDFEKARESEVKKDDMVTKIVAAFLGETTLTIPGDELTWILFLESFVTCYRTQFYSFFDYFTIRFMSVC